jgi:hypothetical protein
MDLRVVDRCFPTGTACPSCGDPDTYVTAFPFAFRWMQPLFAGRLRYRECYRCHWKGAMLLPSEPADGDDETGIGMEEWTQAAKVNAKPTRSGPRGREAGKSRKVV